MVFIISRTNLINEHLTEYTSEMDEIIKNNDALFDLLIEILHDREQHIEGKER